MTRLLALLLVVLMMGEPARADSAPDEQCDVVLDSRLSVYVVTVAGEPYRNKRYLTSDDAVKLRDVLIAAGACERAAPARHCEVKLLAAGDYAIMRDGVNFDPYARLRTLKQANHYAKRLTKMKLCKSTG